MGFTGLLILARTPAPLADVGPLAGLDVELIGRRADHWKFAAVDGYAYDTPRCAAALVDATAAPVLIADVDDSDTALLVADSPRRVRWSALLSALVSATPWGEAAECVEAMAAVAELAVGWAAEAGQVATAEALTQVLSAADRDGRAADQAWLDAEGDLAAMAAIVHDQISFVEVYVMRVLTVLGLAVPTHEGSFWQHLARQADLLHHSRGHRPGLG